MKNLLIGLVLLNSAAAFAQNFKYENLPIVKIKVYTVGIANQVDAKHDQNEKQAMDDLKAQVNTLGRQFIEGSCEAPIKESFNNEDFSSRKSVCYVYFL